jgi:hypothetical protein
MEQDKTGVSINSPHQRRGGEQASESAIKEFANCECVQPIIEPTSYVLPDQTFISLLHCSACGGLERYSIKKLSHDSKSSQKDEEAENKQETAEEGSKESLLKDIELLEAENERLKQKIMRQSRRMRAAQDNQFSQGNNIVTPSKSGVDTQQGIPKKGDSGVSSRLSSPTLSPMVKNALLVSLITGVTITGSTIWRVTTLSGIAIVAGTLLITLPVFLLTDGEIPNQNKQ